MTTDDQPEAEAQPKAKIFVSYSRRDMAFVDRLEPALQARGFRLLIDRAEIYAFEDWWQRIEALIAQADTVVFTLSPDAVASDVCRKEVAFATSLNKRIAPIVCRRVDDKLVPEALARLNFIFFDDEARFEDSLTRLTQALATDIDWIRKHTEFGEAARRWADGGRARGLLLHSPALEQAERWIASRPPEAPAPTEATQVFVTESRRAATRRRNILTGSLAAGLVLALGLAAYAYWQRGLAERNFNAANSTVESIIFDVADGLRDIEGLRTETLRIILERTEKAIGELASQTANDPEVRRSQMVMYNLFSDTYLRLGASQLAADQARNALGIARGLAAAEPNKPDWQRGIALALDKLGDALDARGDPSGALAAFNESLGIRRSLLARNPADRASRIAEAGLLRKIGELRRDDGDHEAALAAYNECLAILRALSARTPFDAEIQRNVSQTMSMIGDVLMAQGDVAQALTNFREALRIARAVAATNPSNAQWQRDLVVNLTSLADALAAQPDVEGAIAATREALALARALAAKDPARTVGQRDVTLSLNRLGSLLAGQGDRPGALAAYRESLAIRRALAAKNPDNPQGQTDVLACLERIGDVLAEQGDNTEAIAAYREALLIARAQVARDQSRLNDRLELAYILFQLGPLIEPGEGRALLTESLAILEKLEQEHKLPGAQKGWLDIVRDKLAKLP